MNLEEAREISQMGWPENQKAQRQHDAVDWLIAEVERLKEDREWQIKQNERMFTALDQIAKHLKLPRDQRDDGVLEQIAEAAMVID